MARKRVTQAQQMADVFADLDRYLRADIRRDQGAPFAFTLTQSHVLAYIAQETMPTETAIARHLYVTGPTVVRCVDSLEQRGLVTRTRSQSDRRFVGISLTEEGVHVQQAYAAWQEQRLARILDRLPAQTVDALIRNLSAFLAAQHEAEAPVRSIA